MASGKTRSPIEIDSTAHELHLLQRRDDLYNAFGIVLSVPWHGRDQEGRWRFGIRDGYTWTSDEIVDQFEHEMKALIRDSASHLVARGILAPERLDQFGAHDYSTGPAAQEWPQFFFDLYQDARPFLADGASLLAWGYFFQDVGRRLWLWAANKEREQSEFPDADNVIYSGTGAMPGIALTRPAIVALCYAHLVNHHGVTQDLTLESFPRVDFPGYSDPDHPGGQESYLIRAKAGRRSFFYHARGTGQVSEHYVIEGATLTLLTLPNFVGEPGRADQDGGYQPGQPWRSQRIKIKGRWVKWCRRDRTAKTNV